ncbi:TGS domain-containing protein [Nostoc sp. ChiQUE01b]|uniref:TGS domain-containing protein n=1 Tax=Nostoc sp. ChiQUE01b TaxID=3075376 RepID=UPI002AD5698C|nr:TGS domain-containing protein [Nostoc sp. ChiQUE01b]MDZ8259873.1 TGS domain-containing protein [Nostoc sp. ChiQUE01b]
MCKIFCCSNILLALATQPGWDGDNRDIEQRTLNLEKLHNLIESGEVTLYIPQDSILLVDMAAREHLSSQEARQVVQKILDLGTTNLGVDYDDILEKANSLDFYPNDTDLSEATCLILAKELNADAILSHYPNVLRQIVTLNVRHFSDFNIPIMNLYSFIKLASEDQIRPINQDKTIFVFTPHHRVIRLPNGATPLDFAYAIHTSIGDRCFEALVNGSEYPLNKPLSNGDIVEIVKSPEVNPDPKWLDFPVTAATKRRIMRSLTHKHQAQGWLVIKQEIGKNIRVYKKGLEYVAQQLNCKSLDELAVKIGSGQERIQKVQELFHQFSCKQENNCLKPIGEEDLITGIGNRNFQIASCCHPIPRQAIVGILTSSERSIRVHHTDCPNIKNLKIEQRISLDWNCDKAKVQLQLRIIDHRDTLRPILNMLADNSITPNLHSVNPCADGTSLISADIVLGSGQNLESILAAVKNMPKVGQLKVKSMIPIPLK